MQTTITTCNTNTWKISTNNNHYTVERKLDTCNCEIRCKSCSTCIHMYSCTCLDATLHITACKHTHMIHINYPPVSNPTNHTTNKQTANYFKKILHPSRTINPPSVTKQSIQRKINDIQIILSTCNNNDALNSVNTHLGNALSILKAIQTQPNGKSLTSKVQIPPNKNHTTQSDYFSTKKSRSTTNITMDKPQLKDVSKCKNELFNTEMELCGICLKQNDSSNTNKVNWISCSECFMWVHKTCSNYAPKDDDDDYVCKYCSI